VVTAPTFDSDEGAGFESDSGDATDDEYIPTPPLNPLKRRRSPESTTSSFHPKSTTASSRSPSPIAARSTKRQRISQNCKSKAPKESREPANWTPKDTKKWTCPRCDHVQWNRRGPDFRRHQRTHTRKENPTPFVCYGLPVEHAHESMKPIPADRRGIAVEYQDVWRVGGCFKPFSRLDALKRHLQATKHGKGCLTDFDEFCAIRDY